MHGGNLYLPAGWLGPLLGFPWVRQRGGRLELRPSLWWRAGGWFLEDGVVCILPWLKGEEYAVRLWKCLDGAEFEMEREGKERKGKERKGKDNWYVGR